MDVTGAAPDVRSSGNVVCLNNFSNQINSAIRIVNQDAAVVDSNFANDVLTNASYIILGQYCYNGTRITRNRVYASKGTCCIGVSDMHGSATNYCIVANNMLVSVDDGTSNMLTTPLNIIKGSYIKTDEPAHWGIVSVSLFAFPPHFGQVQLTKLSILASGLSPPSPGSKF